MPKVSQQETAAELVLKLLEVIEASRQLLPKLEGNCPCGTCQFIRLRDGMLESYSREGVGK